MDGYLLHLSDHTHVSAEYMYWFLAPLEEGKTH